MRSIDLDKEREFENSKVLSSEIRSRETKFYTAVEMENQLFEEKTFMWIKDKSVLEVGCSEGRMAEKYINFASSYVGADISDLAIVKAQSKNISKATFICCDAHEIPLEDESFDIVIVNSLLHHLDLEKGLQEISRLLNYGGYLILREPLGINPLFSLYRALTPSSRTPDERPFTFSELRIINKYFGSKEVFYYGGICLFGALINIRWISRQLGYVDRVFAQTPLKYLMWYFSGIFVKK